MEDTLLEILAAIRSGGTSLDAAWLERLLRRHNRETHDASRRVAKRRLLPYYLSVRAHDPERWKSWGVDEQTERILLDLLRLKPRRTASGVATITVITKPWPCSSNCVYCPSDIRMPKSYLTNEPACQRAERNYFDPYLQVRARLIALREMGHVIDKIELIVLGGTWSDYPLAYQLWFVTELFRALNEFDGEVTRGDTPSERDRRYRAAGLTYDEDELVHRTCELQAAVDAGTLSYNDAIARLKDQGGWHELERWQQGSWDELERQQQANETARCRVVGLCMETRPDLMTQEHVQQMRRMGATKAQMGIQSLEQRILDANGRRVRVEQIAQAFEVLRLAGFKIQVHFMANLIGATPGSDRADYERLVRDPRFMPDEVKLYPCCLVQSAQLTSCFEQGVWQPYGEEELVELLVQDTLATPAFTRISRMIRDIATTDILAGNKRTNLRQLVEDRVRQRSEEVREIRMREVATSDVDPQDLRMDCVAYETTVSRERFLQWVDGENHIAGFLRLSLPHEGLVAMIREVHVYGRVSALHDSTSGAAQHRGLGQTLVEQACTLARDAGFEAIDVISAVGTRPYYRRLGFDDHGLYQRRSLDKGEER